MFNSDEVEEYFDWSNAVGPFSHNLAWCIIYAVPGRFTSPGPGPGPSRQIEWWTSPWRPDPELHHLFQQIGRARLGNALEELWAEDLTEDKITYRSDFEEGILGLDPERIHDF